MVGESPDGMSTVIPRTTGFGVMARVPASALQKAIPNIGVSNAAARLLLAPTTAAGYAALPVRNVKRSARNKL